MSMIEPHYIVAIGASAGSMEEITSFFDHTPLDGVTYIIIQHLSANFKSRMSELLDKHSKLEVNDVEDGMLVERNHVYLIPNDKFMSIHKGRLSLTEKEKVQSPHLTINMFFKSLAADYGKKAIGIILSGMGSDGTEGIKALKAAGGMVIVRDPRNTDFGSMPTNAIGTGLVDFVLEPELMPHAIEDYIKYGEEVIDDHGDDKTISAIINLIKENAALDFSDYKRSTILRRTKRRAVAHNFNTLEEYLGFLKSSPEEAVALSKEFLISVTTFFRDKEPFEFIQQEIIPKILEELKPGEEIKIWVAGCATGEEVYSMAILIAEQLTGKYEDTVVKMFATDIDKIALSHAAKGIYTKEVVKNVSPERLEKYFIIESENYKINPYIRKMIIFAQHDLVKNPPYCNMNFISCRNLLIYMTPILQKKIFNMFLFGLKKDGYLFLGSSENPMPIIKNLEIVNKKWKIFKNLESKRAISFDAFSLPEMLDIRNQTSPFSRKEIAKNIHPALLETIQTHLAIDLNYLAICIDEEMNVIQSYGDTKYLLQKHFTLNLSELLPKPLAIAFYTLRSTALKNNSRETVRGINIVNGDLTLSVDLSVTPLILKREPQRFLLVTFTENKSVSKDKVHENVFDEKKYQNQYILNLEEELKELKEKLHTAYEQLSSSNENVQSFNEELLSANEEMQSTNEEMQSVNEELHTINAEYQSKNKELLEINDDMNNYFRSNINGQLFVDKDLKLMKFSPGAVKQINLLESDIGRPISNITTNIKFETIKEDVKHVLADGSVITKEVQTLDGRWYQIMTMPYIRQADHQNNGAIVTFNDITELKMILEERDNSNKMLEMATSSAGMGTWSLNAQTRKLTTSPRFNEILGFNPNQKLTYEAVVNQFINKQDFVTLIVEKASQHPDGRFDLENAIKKADNGKLCWITFTGSVTYDQNGNTNFFTGLVYDITEQKLDNIRKNDFIAMVSHELKMPLTSVHGYVQLLLAKAKRNEDVYALNALDKTNNHINKMNSLINGFLNLSSFEAGKIHLNKQVFEIDALIKEVVEETVLTSDSHRIEVYPCPEITVDADRDKIGQVINNFLSNAIKYTPANKTINIRCLEINNMLQISVEDQGMGINSQDREQVFDRYYRIDNNQTQITFGFGLGLYLSAEIIKRHNGNIWVESELGKGSNFYFTLPLEKTSI